MNIDSIVDSDAIKLSIENNEFERLKKAWHLSRLCQIK